MTRDVPPYAIVAGIPAKVIKYRYEKDVCDWLLEKQWWNRDENWLRENWRAFHNIEKLRTLLK